MKNLLLYRSPRPESGREAMIAKCAAVCHECGSDEKRRLQPQENRILRGKEGNFQRRIELIDASVIYGRTELSTLKPVYLFSQGGRPR